MAIQESRYLSHRPDIRTALSRHASAHSLWARCSDGTGHPIKELRTGIHGIGVERRQQAAGIVQRSNCQPPGTACKEERSRFLIQCVPYHERDQWMLYTTKEVNLLDINL